ncbi:hypothetical protein [Gordonia caeni]
MTHASSTTTIRRRLAIAAVAGVLSVGGAAGVTATGGLGAAHAVPIDQTNGAVTDASSDIEVAHAAYRDLTMKRLSHEKAVAYARGEMTAKQATRSLNKHLHRYCASARLISRALSDRGYNSATIQNYYHRSGCMGAPSITHNAPKA